MKRPDTRQNIAIVGTGPAGLAAALALSRDGHEVTLIGKLASPHSGKGRTIALLDGSLRFLREFGLDEAIREKGAPLQTLRLIDQTERLLCAPPVTFRAQEIGLDAFGWNIAVIDLIDTLQKALAALPLTILTKEVTGYRCETDKTVLTFHDDTCLASACVVAADGRQSMLRQQAGIGVTEETGNQTALTALLAHERPHDTISTEFHTSEGPFTLVPMQGNQSSLVWMQFSDAAQKTYEMERAAFEESVFCRSKGILGKLTLIGERGLVPLQGLYASTHAKDRLALIGESAHAFPPIGAQGFNLTLRDVYALREALRNEASPIAALASYAKKRRIDGRLRKTGVNLLNTSLIAASRPLDLLRMTGLAALNTFPFLRRLAMREGLEPQWLSQS
jgi:2-octaprenyl-6-methoxyphenol hydroxylase